MTKRVVVTDPQEEVASTLEKLTNNRIGRLPVLENSQLVGIISKTDVMKALEMKKSTLSQ
jgi:CBS domain-containing protein